MRLRRWWTVVGGTLVAGCFYADFSIEPSSGGQAGNSGSPLAGSSAGGSVPSGGVTAQAGTTPSGGARPFGGVGPSGGHGPSGGTQAQGGNVAFGGAAPAGAGGVSGGTTPSGGATHAGGAAAGGAPPVGGSTPQGGTAISSGAGGQVGGEGGITAAGGMAPGGSPQAGADQGGTAGSGGLSGGTESGGVGTGGVLQGGTAGSGGAAGGSAGGVGCTGPYERMDGGLCVATLVTVGSGGTSFSIDATEVTRGQYAAWLASNPPLPDAADARCGWKSIGTYQPVASCINDSTAYYDGPDAEHHPVVCVDWCDALAYCLSVGKRLCGRIGGGPVPFNLANNASYNQWYAACTSNGQYAYPYGSTYAGQACNGENYPWTGSGPHSTVPVGSLGGCQAPLGSAYLGVYDLSGNAAEWVESCDSGGQAGLCHRHGGSFRAAATDSTGTVGTLECKVGGTDYARDRVTDGLGFRCCLDS